MRKMYGGFVQDICRVLVKLGYQLDALGCTWQNDEFLLKSIVQACWKRKLHGVNPPFNQILLECC